VAVSLWIMPFGKHKGEGIEDVPSSYLEWLLEQEWFCDKFSEKVSVVEKEMKFRERFSDGDEPAEDRNWNRNRR